MGWRDGCAPLPAAGRSQAAAFDFVAADALGTRLHLARSLVEAHLEVRAAARRHLVDWTGGHRREHDAQSEVLERALASGAAGLARDLARLRAAWDLAAALQEGRLGALADE